jgi:hypothetical protein
MPDRVCTKKRVSNEPQRYPIPESFSNSALVKRGTTGGCDVRDQSAAAQRADAQHFRVVPPATVSVSLWKLVLVPEEMKWCSSTQ